MAEAASALRWAAQKHAAVYQNQQAPVLFRER